MVQMGKMLPEVVVPLCYVFLEPKLLPKTTFMREESVPVPLSKQCGHEMDIYTYNVSM